MPQTWIILTLGIAVLLLVYILYTYTTSSGGDVLATSLDLTTAPSDITVAASNANSSVFTIAFWIHFNNWPDASDIMSFSTTWILKADTKKGVLKLNIDEVDYSITSNFPIQKTTHVAFSVNNAFTDVYINGKMVKSINKTIATPTATTVTFTSTPARIAKLKRWGTEALNPTQVWSEYYRGSGDSSIFSYGMAVGLLQNNVAISNVRLM